MTRKSLSFVICFFITITALINVNDAQAQLIERRKPQFTTNEGYLLIPAPYSLKGIGDGVAFAGVYYNLFSTTTDIFVNYLTGDLQGLGAGITELHIVPKRLFLDVTYQDLKDAVFESYAKRGMDEDRGDYTLVEIENMTFVASRMTLSFKERMFELYLQANYGRYDINSLKDSEGNLIAIAGENAGDDFIEYGAGLMLDVTDDRSDPRRGLRLDSNLSWSPPKDESNPDFSVLDANVSLYLPFGKRSTWVFNYFHSSAFVHSGGETDRQVLKSDLGFDCTTIADINKRNQCIKSTNEYLDNIIAQNKYGTSVSLGGRSRLRSYPENRFNGAHTSFFGTEFRWNIIEESKPFNLGLIKDVRTSVQAAFFYEIGSVGERSKNLWYEHRSSIGAGLRIVNASGLIYRFDFATGEEGNAFTVIINYPWESF